MPYLPLRLPLLVALFASAFGCTGSGGGDAGTNAGTGGKADDKSDPSRAAVPGPIMRPAEISSALVGDVDADGHLDLAFLEGTTGVEPKVSQLVVYWGDEAGAFAEFTEVLYPVAQYSGMRDTATELVAALDWAGDAETDLVTAAGAYVQSAPREFEWQPLPESSLAFYGPVGVLEDGDTPRIARGLADGSVDVCTPAGCERLLGRATCDPAMLDCRTIELHVADFDRDGTLDVLAGAEPIEEPFIVHSTLWTDLTKPPLVVEEMHQADVEVGDIDGDGWIDVVVQKREFISDFPSQTDVWRNLGGSPVNFERVQVIGNRDNHTDNEALADVNGDDCLDLAHTGVDEARVSFRLGTPVAGGGCEPTLGPHDPTKPTDIGWRWIPAPYGLYGAQVVDVDADGVLEVLIRAHRGFHDGGMNFEFLRVSEELLMDTN